MNGILIGQRQVLIKSQIMVENRLIFLLLSRCDFRFPVLFDEFLEKRKRKSKTDILLLDTGFELEFIVLNMHFWKTLPKTKLLRQNYTGLT